MMNLNDPGTLIQLRDEQLRQAVNAAKAAFTIDNKIGDMLQDNSDERLLTEEQVNLLVKAVKCLESVLEDEF